MSESAQTRVAIIGIIIEDPARVEQVQHLLSEYSEYIIGRMGIPYKEKNIRIISVAIDTDPDKINALSGKIGRLPGVAAKAVYQNA